MPVVGQHLCWVRISISCNCCHSPGVDAISPYFITEEAQALMIKLACLSILRVEACSPAFKAALSLQALVSFLLPQTFVFIWFLISSGSLFLMLC